MLVVRAPERFAAVKPPQAKEKRGRDAFKTWSMVNLFRGSKGGKGAAQPAKDAAAAPALATVLPAKDPAGAIKPAAIAALKTVKVKVPPGGKPGKEISVNADGERHVIRLPPGSKPGAVVEVAVPSPGAAAVRFEADDAGREVPIAAEVAGEKLSSRSSLFDVGSDDAASSAGKRPLGHHGQPLRR